MIKKEMYEREIKELNKQLYNSYKRIKELNDKDKKGDKWCHKN